MKRREFITLLGGTAAVWLRAAEAQQQQAIPVIGFLNGGAPEGYAPHLTAFRQGLRETGYLEGRNLAIEYRWAEGHYDRLPALAADLVRRRVIVIAATSTPAALIAKAATTTIPIVFTTSTDPVRLALVASLSRPGGNVTGAAQLNVEVAPKRLELLHELLPAAKIMALLVNPTNLNTASIPDMQAAVGTLGLQLHVLHASTARDFDAVFATSLQLRAGGLVIGSADPFFTSQSEQLAALSVRHRLPTVFQSRVFTAAGGLMSYGGNPTDSYRLAGAYTGRILKGEKPSDLPVQQATKIELIINMKTAKALGLTFPITLLGRADEVIE
jgi:putative ABC transport system substrate-binding protein